MIFPSETVDFDDKIFLRPHHIIIIHTINVFIPTKTLTKFFLRIRTTGRILFGFVRVHSDFRVPIYVYIRNVTDVGYPFYLDFLIRNPSCD